MTTTTDEMIARNIYYGVDETNPAPYPENVDHGPSWTLAAVAAAGGRVTRVRILADCWSGTWMADVSYVLATLPTGEAVSINDAIEAGPLYGRRGLKARMIEWAKDEGVYASALGLLDESRWSILKGC